MEELTQEQQDFLDERLDFLKHKRSKLKEIRTLYQWEEAYEIISFSLAQEEARLQHAKDGYTDSTIVGLKEAKSKLNTTRDYMLKKKENKAAEPFWDGINEIMRDYNDIIYRLENKVNLRLFFAKSYND